MEIPEVINGEKYNLKWNRHHTIIATNVLEHLSEEELVDVTLTCEGKFIKAHKLILSSSSEYFKELFQRHRDQNPIIIMTNIRFDYLKYIIDYIYKGEVKLLSSEIQGILNLANELQIKGLYGILNKTAQTIADINEDKNFTVKSKKLNNKNEGSRDESNSETKKSDFKTTDSNEVQTRPKHRSINANKKERNSSLKQNKNKRRKLNPIKPDSVFQNIDLSQAFKEVLPQPDESMEVDLSEAFKEILPKSKNSTLQEPPSPRESTKIMLPSYDPPTSTSQAETNISNVASVPSMPEANQGESSGSTSQVNNTYTNSNSIIKKLKETSNVSSREIVHSLKSSPDVSQTFIKKIKSEEILDFLKRRFNNSESPKPVDCSENNSSLKQISAFMLFTDEYRPKVSSEHPNESVKQISLRLSGMWKNLSVERKHAYYEEASRKNEILKQKIKK